MKRFVRDVAIIALATACSRVFGLFRDIVIADRFGAGDAYDAYIIAFFVPHFLRRLLAEGALALSFIPVYTEYLKKDKEEADELASNVLNFLLVLFPLLVIIGVLLAPDFVPFLASGFPQEKIALTVQLTRIIFPFIGFIGLAALVMGLLNAKGHFFAPAFAPVFFNIGVISGALFIGSHFKRPIFGLAVGVLIGGLGQLGFQLPFLRKHGFNWKFRFFPIHPGLKQAGRMMLPVIVGLVAAQVNIMVDNKLASYLSAGSISSLQYATRLFQLPLGLFTIAISTAILPRLSGKWARNDTQGFSETLKHGISLCTLIILPAMIGLWVMGEPVIKLLFEHRSFTPADTARTAYVLNYYLIGLAGYSLVHLFTRAFYSIQKTFVPVLSGIIAVFVNVGLDLLLIKPMGIGGLALATAMSGIVNGLVLLFLFFYTTEIQGFLPRPRLIIKILLSVVLMGLTVFFLKNWLINFNIGEFGRVIFPILSGAAIYALLSYLLGVKKAVLDEVQIID